MKKKLVLVNSLIVFLSLIILLIVSSIIIYNQSYNLYSKQAKNYLVLVSNIFDGTNYDGAKTVIKETDNDVRLTIIDISGNVIIDSKDEEIAENHLDRPELQSENLGKVFKRYSKTNKCEMLYVAGIKGNNYIRISIAMKNVTNILSIYISIIIVFLLLIIALSIVFINYFNKKSLAKVNETVKQMSNLTMKESNLVATTIDDLPLILSSLTNLLNENITKLNDQKNEVNMILDNLNQGIIVINNKGNLNFINKMTKVIFHVDESMLNKNYLFLVRDVNFQKVISETLEDHINKEYHFEYESKVYECKVIYSDSNVSFNGVIITMEDVTEKDKLARTKRDFFQNASHELKSPLTTIIGYQQLIVENIIDDPKQIIDYSSKTLQEAKRMNGIIIDMLDLAYLEQNYQKKEETIEVDSLVKDVVKSFEPSLRNKNITVDLNLVTLKVKSDKKLMDELIRNIIDNAIKYNKDSGKIAISINNNELKIADTGIGIPENEQANVFERFYRVDKGRSKSLGGTGLGLAIVKHICEIYGYKIKLDSTLDKGTTITIKFL